MPNSTPSHSLGKLQNQRLQRRRTNQCRYFTRVLRQREVASRHGPRLHQRERWFQEVPSPMLIHTDRIFRRIQTPFNSNATTTYDGAEVLELANSILLAYANCGECVIAYRYDHVLREIRLEMWRINDDIENSRIMKMASFPVAFSTSTSSTPSTTALNSNATTAELTLTSRWIVRVCEAFNGSVIAVQLYVDAATNCHQQSQTQFQQGEHRRENWLTIVPNPTRCGWRNVAKCRILHAYVASYFPHFSLSPLSLQLVDAVQRKWQLVLNSAEAIHRLLFCVDSINSEDLDEGLTSESIIEHTATSSSIFSSFSTTPFLLDSKYVDLDLNLSASPLRGEDDQRARALMIRVVEQLSFQPEAYMTDLLMIERTLQSDYPLLLSDYAVTIVSTSIQSIVVVVVATFSNVRRGSERRRIDVLDIDFDQSTVSKFGPSENLVKRFEGAIKDRPLTAHQLGIAVSKKLLEQSILPEGHHSLRTFGYRLSESL